MTTYDTALTPLRTPTNTHLVVLGFLDFLDLSG